MFYTFHRLFLLLLLSTSRRPFVLVAICALLILPLPSPSPSYFPVSRPLVLPIGRSVRAVCAACNCIFVYIKTDTQWLAWRCYSYSDVKIH